ncbi:hypothetical protein ACNSOL_00050 [Aliarcobacter lanthieri]|uniref:hypothetical protein n=1 Tax=Aliarcobacter lanthieri TaxID=1355374 RepID=UPI003AB0CE00
MDNKNLTLKEYQATKSLISQNIEKIEEIFSYSSCNEFTTGIHKVKQLFFANGIVLNFYCKIGTKIILKIKIFEKELDDVNQNTLQAL